MLSAGTNQIPFNLYRAATYTADNIWGSSATNMSITSYFGGVLAVGSYTNTYSVYAKISAAELAGARGVADGNAMYTASFAGAGKILYTSASILILACETSGQTAPFSFNVQANVVNDCYVTTTPLAFGTTGTLGGAARALGSLGVKCTAGSSYRVALNGGQAAGASGGRRMRNAATGETVDYALSTTLDGPEWGDGTGASTTYDATGTGFAQNVAVYGRVRVQTTPSPGDYSDRVTATIYF